MGPAAQTQRQRVPRQNATWEKPHAYPQPRSFPQAFGLSRKNIWLIVASDGGSSHQLQTTPILCSVAAGRFAVCSGRNPPCSMFCRLQPWPSRTDADTGRCQEQGALFPQEAAHSIQGWGSLPSVLGEKRLSRCPVGGEPRARGDGRKHGPTIGRPSPSCAGTWDPRAENLSQGFRECQCPQGRSGRPSSMFCSGDFTPAQASAETATSFKIWPQTFITQC